MQIAEAESRTAHQFGCVVPILNKTEPGTEQIASPQTTQQIRTALLERLAAELGVSHYSVSRETETV